MADKIQPVLPSKWQLFQHRVSAFDCELPAGVAREDLEKPDLWYHVARQLTFGSEIRAVAEDTSFVAYLFVTHVYGNDVRVKITNFIELEAVGDIDIDTSGDYVIKLCGPKKFCIVDKRDGSHLKENIPTKQQAQRELADHERALAS